MNKTILMGRLTKDPEVECSRIEQYCNGTIHAGSRQTISKGWKKRETDFISCVTFGKNAEFAEKYLKKGLKILVSGQYRQEAM